MGNIKEANYRITRYNGEYRIEVEDKPIGHWYIVKSKIKELWQAVEECNKYEQFDEPFGDPGIIGKDYIPIDWVERLEEYGKWKIVRADEKPTLTTEDIKRILSIVSEIMLYEAYYKNENFTMNKEEYFEEILKRYNDE